MGYSASTLDQHLSISASAMVVDAVDLAESDTDCFRTPPTLHPPPTIANSVRSRSRPLLFVASGDDAWDLIDDGGEDEAEEEEEYHLVERIESSLHKLLETYEVVEPGESFDKVSSMSCKPVFADVRSLSESEKFDSRQSDVTDMDLGLGRGDDKVVLYVTSMRGIRKTYEDCRAVKLILDGFRLVFDERDVVMDVKYRQELQSLMGLEGKGVALPQLFIGSKNVGGVDEVMRLHETGELRKLLEGYPVRHSMLACCLCGDARFLVCAHCSGSSKVFDGECGVSSKCSRCSENGLVKCFICNA